MSTWIEILRDAGLPFFDRHHSKMKNAECVIPCPLCGDDPSAHMNLFPDGSFYCLRNATHGGHNPRFLLYTLKLPFSVTFDRESSVRKLDPNRIRIADLEMPKEFLELRVGCAKDPFVKYLAGRGFGPSDLEYLVQNYRIRVAVSGRYSFRVIIPIYHEKRLVSWTARSIADHPIRYLSLSTEQGALRPLTDVLFTPYEYNTAILERIVVCEGPFDAMKLNVLQNTRIMGVSLQGKRLSQAQLMQLIRFRLPVTVALDSDAWSEAEDMRDRIASHGLDVNVERISREEKDIGNMTWEEIECRFA